MSQLQHEIHEQPTVIAGLLERESETVKRIAATIHEYDPQFVVIAARGTSDNAARYAQYVFGARLGWTVALAAPSLHTLYQAKPTMRRALVIGISQSGQSEDVRRVLRDAGSQGALTLAITNDAASPLANEAAHHLPLNAGLERSVAATKTYTASLAAIALLTSALTDLAEDRATLAEIPAAIMQTLDAAQSIQEWVGDYRDMRSYAAVGRGFNYCTAYEISLKIKELCYIPGEEYSEADFRHGPIAIVGERFPVIAVAPTGQTFAKQADLLEQLNSKGADCLVISDDHSLAAQAKHFMALPPLPEWLSPLAAVIPGQVLALELAAANGYDIDAPRGLSKVTVTE